MERGYRQQLDWLNFKMGGDICFLNALINQHSGKVEKLTHKFLKKA